MSESSGSRDERPRETARRQWWVPSPWARLFLVGLLAAVVTIPALRVVPLGHRELGPATVSPRVIPGVGLTSLVVPPLGTVSARTHSGPITLQVTLSRLDFPALQTAVSTERGRALLASDVESGLRAMARSAAMLLLVAGILIGGVVGALVPRRRGSHLIAGAAGGLAAVVATIGIAAFTYNPSAFNEPIYTGALTRAPQVIEAVNEGIDSLDEFRSRYETAAERLSELLSVAADPIADPGAGTIVLLHVSDIHSNPLGVELALQLARQFEVDAVVDTGDLTSFGAPIEARVAADIADFPVPYVFVPGNHDSTFNRREISRVDNVVLVDEEVESVRGIDILGVADPTFTASNEVSTEDANRIKEESAAEVAELVDETQPDVLAVHDARQAGESFGSVPLVLAGHTHEGAFEQREGTLLAAVGSTGATGLGSFTVEEDVPYEAEIIYFKGGLPIALDYVRFTGFGADFEIERRTFDPPEPVNLEESPAPGDGD